MHEFVAFFIVYWVLLFLINLAITFYDLECLGPMVYFLAIIGLTTIGALISTIVTFVGVIFIVSLITIFGGVFM